MSVSDTVSGTVTSSARIAPAGHSDGAVNAWRVNDAYAWSLAVWVPAVMKSAAASASVKHGGRGRRGGHSAGVEECIGSTENGGDYGRSTNRTHFGRYQYDRATWEANGGDPATWGSATPEEQDRVFRDTVNRYGYAPWRGDGCV